MSFFLQGFSFRPSVIFPVVFRALLLIGLGGSPCSLLLGQVSQTANNVVVPYPNGLLAGVNPGAHPPYTDEQLSNLSAGNPALGIEGIGAKTLRPGLTDAFLEEFGYNIRVSTFEHYAQLGMKDHTVIAGFPSPAHRDPNYYCPDHQSELFDHLYEPIWDNGANGTPVNDNNYAALYFWKAVNTYKPYVKFWEIWNEPGFDYTNLHGFSEPGSPGNWWDADPAPCDYKLRAPIQHYVRLLRIAYEVIKTADPSAYVLCGGVGYPSFLDAILRNTDNPNGGAVTAAYPLKGGAYFDAVGYHSYPHFDSSTRTYNDSTQSFDYFRHSDGAAEGVTVVKNRFVPVLKKHGYDGSVFPEKLWLITEINVPRKEFAPYLMGSDALQRNFMLKAYIECQKENFAQMHVYALNELESEAEATFEFDQMGLYKKLDYNNLYLQTRNEEGIALKTATDILTGTQYDAARTLALNLPPHIGGAALQHPSGQYTYALWAKTAIDRSEEASATYFFPNNFFGPQIVLQRRNWDYGATRKVTPGFPANGVALDATPVFFTEAAYFQSDFIACAPAQVGFSATNWIGNFNFEWTLPGASPSQITGIGAATYSQAGVYPVHFKAKDFSGNVVWEETGSITIETAPQAAFEGAPSGGVVIFQNLSIPNADAFSWSFGDGNSSQAANPTHVFYEDGTYTVKLTAQNHCGTHSFSKTYAINAATSTEIDFTAVDSVAPYLEPFRAGAIPRLIDGWNDEQLADIAAGNAIVGQEGAGVRSARLLLPQYFLDFWGYGIRKNTFQHYQNLDMAGNTALLGFPKPESREPYRYCETDAAVIFKDLYTDIWDGGANGTPINEANPYALYVWHTVQTYRDYVDFWQVYDAPDYDISGKHGWLPPGEPGNWWDFDPDPCDISLRAPVESYVRMLRITYEIVKNLDPDAYVLLGGIGYTSFLDAVLRNTDNPNGGAVHPRYPQTGGAYFDAIGFNSYPFVDGSTAQYDPAVGAVVYQRHSDAAAKGIMAGRAKFQAVLNNYGFNGIQRPAKKWLITEANVPRKQFDAYFGGEIAQRNYLTKAMVEAMAGGFVRFSVNALHENEPIATAAGPDDLMGLYAFNNGQPPYTQQLTPGGKAFKTASTLLYRTTYDPVRTMLLNLPDGVLGYAFRDLQNRFIYVLWAETQTDNSEVASKTYSFPNGLAVGQLWKKIWNWADTKTQNQINPTNIALTASPIFLTESELPAVLPVAAFAADAVDICKGMQVHFTDLSTETQTLEWHFEGGNPAFSTEKNPIVQYPAIGKYAVMLKATNQFGSHTTTQLEHIHVDQVPQPQFSFSVSSQTVQFSNQTNGQIDSLKWILHDGSIVYAWQFERYYWQNGDFPVKLVVFSPCGSDTITKTVNIQTTPIANFGVLLPGQCGQYYAAFQNYSTSSPDQVQWIMPGANPAYSTDVNVFVGYPGPGSYSVTLIVQNAFGSDTMTQTFNLSNAVYHHVFQNICENESLEIAGQLFDAAHPSGEILIANGSAQGCDSIINVNLQVIQTAHINLFDTIPAGGTVPFCGNFYDQSGTYTCELMGYLGCDSIVTLHLNLLVGAENVAEKSAEIRAYPNPFSTATTLEWTQTQAETVTLDLYAASGQHLRTILDNQLIGSGRHQLNIDLNGLPSGVYWLTCRSGRQIWRLPLVKNNE